MLASFVSIWGQGRLTAWPGTLKNQLTALHPIRQTAQKWQPGVRDSCGWKPPPANTFCLPPRSKDRCYKPAWPLHGVAAWQDRIFILCASSKPFVSGTLKSDKIGCSQQQEIPIGEKFFLVKWNLLSTTYTSPENSNPALISQATLTLCSGCRSHSFNKRLSQLSASFLLMLEGLEEEKNLIHNSIFALVLFSNLRNMQKHEKDVQLWVVLSCDVLTLACQENLHYMHNLLCCRYLH